MSRGWLDPDRSFDDAFGVRPMMVEHELAGHPLLSRDAMIELAATMPSHLIEHHRGRDLDLVMPDLNWDVVEAPPLEVAHEIESSGTWMVFWHVEELPEYNALLHETLDGVMSRVSKREGELGPLEGFIFFSAPGTVTPAHVDPEHNFLLQVLGTKKFVAGAYPDVGIQQRTAERYYLNGAHRNLDWLPPEALVADLEPGKGVYSPYLCPHWVNNGDEVSISFSATFQTTKRQKWGRVHRFNGRLRRLGLSPRPPGQAPLLDDSKRLVEAVASKTEALLGERNTSHWRRGDEEQMAEGQYGTRVR